METGDRAAVLLLRRTQQTLRERERDRDRSVMKRKVFIGAWESAGACLGSVGKIEAQPNTKKGLALARPNTKGSASARPCGPAHGWLGPLITADSRRIFFFFFNSIREIFSNFIEKISCVHFIYLNKKYKID